MPRLNARVARLVLALVVGPSAAARASDVALRVRPTFTQSGADSIDETNRTTVSRSTQYLQSNQLSLDSQLFPTLRLSASGAYDFARGYSIDDGLSSAYNPQSWNGRAMLSWGIPQLNASLAYDRRQGFADIQSGQSRFTSTTPINEAFSGRAAWRPLDLPNVDLTFSRTHLADVARLEQDRLNDSVGLNFAYHPEQRLTLTHRMAFSHPNDLLQGFESNELTNTFAGNWTDKFLDGRVTASVSLTGGTRAASVVHASADGTVERRRFPMEGYSAIDTFPLQPDRITLASNPGLIDGNLTTSAGLNVGFGPSATNDLVGRELGAQFRPGEGAVNVVFVWTDKAVPADVAGTFTWQAWQSTDNVTWTPVRLVGAVKFSLFYNRFEIRIEPTEAPYLKVVTRPLPVGVTTDERFRELLITEAQFSELTLASAGGQQQVQLFGTLSSTLRARLLTGPVSVSYDFAGFLSHSNLRALPALTVANGVSAERRLSSSVNLSGRVERTDTIDSGGHRATNRAGVSLGFDPLPSFAMSASYGGVLGQVPQGIEWSQSASLFARATPYAGISTMASVSAGTGASAAGRGSENYSATAGLSVVPSRTVSLTVGFSTGRSIARGGGALDLDSVRTAVDGAVSVTPVRALALSGGVSRQWLTGLAPATLANFSGSFSPFQEGQLQFRYLYQESLNTGGDTRTRNHGPTLRWNIRPSWYLDAGCTFFDTTSPTLRSSAYSLFASTALSFK